MTANRTFKRRVRARAAKTGESYTAALRHFRPNPKGQTMEQDMHAVLERVASGELDSDAAYQELRQFRDRRSIDGPVRRVEVVGRFLNVDIEVDPKLDHAVVETGPGWTAHHHGEVVAIDGPGFTHAADEMALDADGKEVHARRLEGWGDCVIRLKVPSRTEFGGEVMAWRIVTPGVKMHRGWLYSEYASIASESDERDDPYRQALAELAAKTLDVTQTAERLRGIRSPA